MTHPQPHNPKHKAFSLIELMVVIAVIAILLGISVPLISMFRSGAKEAQTIAMLNALAGAADEFNIRTQTTVDHEPFTSEGPGDRTIGEFLVQVTQIPEVENMIRSGARGGLNDNIDNLGDPFTDRDDCYILDPWQVGASGAAVPIRYAAYVDHNDDFDEDNYLPPHPRPFFVSPGPDGLFGSVIDNTNDPDPGVDVNGDGEPDAADNLYSYDIDS